MLQTEAVTESGGGRAKIGMALISVNDRAGLVPLACFLRRKGVRLIATSGTAEYLGKNGIDVHKTESLTGFGQVMGGRLKTLHPTIHGGLLGRRDVKADVEVMQKYKMPCFDLLVANFYPFPANTESKDKYTHEQIIESIDIGGSAMLRAAAKNYRYLTVVHDRKDYMEIQKELETSGGICLATREKLAHKAFAVTAAYDAAIDRYFATFRGGFPLSVAEARFAENLHYGENPHQSAALYRTQTTPPLFTRISSGNALSYNNYVDFGVVIELVDSLGTGAACAIVKHASPCGVAIGEHIQDAFVKAYESDPVSVFGGIIGLNRRMDEATARLVASRFYSGVAACGYTEAALRVLQEKQGLKLVDVDAEGIKYWMQKKHEIRYVAGGCLMQERDLKMFGDIEVRSCTSKDVDTREAQDLLFAWRVSKFCRSNAVVCACDGQVLGVGSGCLNRIDATRAALGNAQKFHSSLVERSVLASDGFFPFDDCVELAAENGVKCIMQPGGAKMDGKVISTSDRFGVAMVLSGMRHFKH